MQLSDRRLAEPKLHEQGFKIRFLSTIRLAIVNSSLKAADIHYTLPPDSHLEAANAFYLAYHPDDATLAKQRQYGLNRDETTGTPLRELPVLSGFIIDATGTIRYVSRIPIVRSVSPPMRVQSPRSPMRRGGPRPNRRCLCDRSVSRRLVSDLPEMAGRLLASWVQDGLTTAVENADNREI